MKQPLYLCFFLLLLPALTKAQAWSQNYEQMTIQSSKYWLDIDYVGDGHVGHRLDIHLPKQEKEKYPVVLCIYGSAWLSNSWKGNTFLDGLGQALLENGFAVVSINYRASSDAKFPAQVHDVKAAIRFVRANAASFSLDDQFIGITGWSSGGHLAAFAGTTSGRDSFEIDGQTIDLEGKLGKFTSTSSRVDAVVDWFGPTDFLVMDQCGSAMVHNDAQSPESALIGGAIQDHPLDCQLADPATYVKEDNPPFLIFHGNKDPLVPHCQSEHLHTKQEEAGAPSELIIIEGGKHGPGVLIPTYYEKMIAFLVGLIK